MYYIGICDSEPVFLRQMMAMTRKILTEERISFHIRTFHDTGTLEKYLHSPDRILNLLFLTVTMEKENGITYARRLREMGNDIPIVFISSTTDYALDGYSVDSIGYILKPVCKNDLQKTLLHAYQKHKKQTMVLTSASRAVSFQLDDVLYLEIQDKELAIHVNNGILNISVPLNSLISRLPPEQFVRCYRSYIVSLSAIRSVWRYGIELKNHEKIPVSRSYYPVVQNALINLFGDN